MKAPAPASRPRLSVVVPVYDDAANLRVLLDSIYANAFKDFEVVVVDDASPRDDVERAARAFPVRYVRHERNRCVAAARNTGARHARADILVFFDSDVVVERDTLQRFAAAYDDPRVMYYQAINAKTPANRGFGPELLALRWHFLTYGLEKSSVHSLYFSIRKDVFLGHGGFDESFTGLGAEEFELGQRLARDIELHTDMDLQLRHNFQGVLGRALSLFKRTVRYSLMFIFRTRRFESETGTKKEVFSAILAVVVCAGFCGAAAAAVLGQRWSAHLAALAGGLLVLHLLLQARFFGFLVEERGPLFAAAAAPAVFLWSLATGGGIAVALVVAAGRVLAGRKYPAGPAGR